jgi:hypothetical protein
MGAGRGGVRHLHPPNWNFIKKTIKTAEKDIRQTLIIKSKVIFKLSLLILS